MISAALPIIQELVFVCARRKTQIASSILWYDRIGNAIELHIVWDGHTKREQEIGIYQTIGGLIARVIVYSSMHHHMEKKLNVLIGLNTFADHVIHQVIVKNYS